MEHELDQEVRFYRSRSLAPSTKDTYKSQLRKYRQFCWDFNYPLAPISDSNLVRYIAYLARSISPQSIDKYLNVIRLIHLELGYKNPLENKHLVQSVLKGVARHKGLSVDKKLPISPTLLLNIRAQLNLANLNDCVFWAICLTLFFTWLRKSNVLPDSLKSFDSSKGLCRGDFVVSLKAPCQGMFVNIRWTKTIQYKDRVLICPLPFLPRHPLCPVTAILQAFRQTPQADSNGPAFLWLGQIKQLIPCTYPGFLSKLRFHLINCNVDPSRYTSHSFRRGGCSWGLSQGLNPDLLKQLGDWKSECYQEYVSVQLKDKISAIQQFACSLPTTF